MGRSCAAPAWSRPAGASISSLSIQPPDGTRPVNLLSGGNQQKVLVGKWLIRAPRILILDEPTVGVDVGAKAEIYAILRRERDRGAAVLVVSSDLEEVMTVADRIGVMVSGRLVAVHDADAVRDGRDRARDRNGRGMSAGGAVTPSHFKGLDRGQRAADRDSGDRDRLFGGAARIHQPRQSHRNRAPGRPRRDHGDVHHLRHHDGRRRPVGRAGARRRRSRLLLFARGRPAARPCHSRGAFGRRAGGTGERRGDRLPRAAADHRHARHAQHRARVGADPRRSGAASHPQPAGIHVHRRRQSLRPARSRSTFSRSWRSS